MIYVLILVTVAFFSLMERKLLRSIRIRVGPQYVGYWGLLQSFADAVKLLFKEIWRPILRNYLVFYITPILNLVLVLLVWIIFPFMENGLYWFFGVLFFFCVRRLNVYPLLRSGWASNSKYSLLGRLRGVAQIVSYEISIIIVILRVIWISIGSFNLKEIIEVQFNIYNLFLLFPLIIIWLVSILAETNRNPYSFSEGESELVSGFNTEYIARGFILFFLGEYLSILLMRIIIVVMFLSRRFGFIFIVKIIILSYCFIWVRATVLRYRYDKLMDLAWKFLLPIRLILLIFCVVICYYI